MGAVLCLVTAQKRPRCELCATRMGLTAPEDLPVEAPQPSLEERLELWRKKPQQALDFDSTVRPDAGTSGDHADHEGEGQ